MEELDLVYFKQLGISLLEVLISLSIIAIVLIMAARYFFITTNNTKLSNAISQVGGLVAAAHSWKGIKISFTGLSIQTLYDDGQLEHFPGLDDSTPSHISINDLWGDHFYIAPAAGNKASITLTLPNALNCQALANAYAGATCSNSDFTYTFS